MPRTTSKNSTPPEFPTLSLRELQALFTREVGEPTKCPNRKFLVRRIQEARVFRAAALPAGSTPLRGRFAGMTIEHLREEYARVVGRPSGSNDAGYLKWKIREAEKGRITLGPRRVPVPGARTIPLNLSEEALAALDDAWKSHGATSRTAFVRLAIGNHLRQLGEATAADLFTAGR